MRVDVLTKEYPPNIYGGAGVHVTELVRALRTSIEVQVRSFGSPIKEPDTTGYHIPGAFDAANPVTQTLAVNLLMAEATAGADVVHSHTWYANEAGRRAQQLHGIPHVITAHSLEPLRPWKAEQLGGGYRVSSDIERRAYESADRIVAVSNGMREDILRCYPSVDPTRVLTIHNGIDLSVWQPIETAGVLERYGVDRGRPTIIFVGRITRQKGLPYLLKAMRQVPSDVQLVLCAGAPDTPEIAAEVADLVAELQRERTGVVWIPDHLPQPELATLLTAATVFVCPSIYEPLGIVNLEAMACGLPVVGTATGGIPEVVAHGSTGWLVPIDQAQDGTGLPTDPAKFIADLANTLQDAVADPARARSFGEAGRVRAAAEFSWEQIAHRTRALYEELISERVGF
ncbi:MAG: glycogen synthase [Agromyces sp.]